VEQTTAVKRNEEAKRGEELNLVDQAQPRQATQADHGRDQQIAANQQRPSMSQSRIVPQSREEQAAQHFEQLEQELAHLQVQEGELLKEFEMLAIAAEHAQAKNVALTLAEIRRQIKQNEASRASLLQDGEVK